MINTKCIIIPGPRKCGSSTLYSLLVNHPKLDTPFTKEPFFFALPEKIIRNNLNSYKKLYPNKLNKPFIDGSTIYFSSDRAKINIKKYIKNPKLIIILRDPAKRVYSSYFHMVKKVPKQELRDFEFILENISGGTKKEIKKSENSLLKEAINENLINDKYIDESYLKNKYDAPFESSFEDTLWFYKYFQGSIYSENYEFIKRTFDKNQIKLVFLEELISSPDKVINGLLEFVEEGYYDIELPHANKTLIPNNELANIVQKFSSSKVGYKLHYFLNILGLGFLPNRIREKFYGAKPKLSKEEYESIRDKLYFEYDYWFTKYPKLKKFWRF